MTSNIKIKKNNNEVSSIIIDEPKTYNSLSFKNLSDLLKALKKLDIKIVSAGFDPISKLSEIPNNPKQRYELMTKDMPLGGELSLDMMYRTCGTQLNIDYSSEEDFIKKFK